MIPYIIEYQSNSETGKPWRVCQFSSDYNSKSNKIMGKTFLQHLADCYSKDRKHPILHRLRRMKKIIKEEYI